MTTLAFAMFYFSPVGIGCFTPVPSLAGCLAFKQYLGLCEMVANAWSKEGIQALTRMLAIAPPDLTRDYTTRTDWIKRFLIRGTQAGETAAFLFGLVAAKVCYYSKVLRFFLEQKVGV